VAPWISRCTGGGLLGTSAMEEYVRGSSSEPHVNANGTLFSEVLLEKLVLCGPTPTAGRGA
jgi:hypothetical protein